MKIDNKDQIVILAGGIGKRLGNLTKKKPKSLLPFHKKPFIFYQMDLLKKKGFKNILFLIGHQGQQIKKTLKNYNFSNININFSNEGSKRLGTGGALKKAKKKLFDNFFLIYGDTYPQINFDQLKQNHFKKKLPYTMVVYKNMNKLDKSNVFIKKGKVINYSKLSKKAQHIDYGVSLIEKDILKNIKKNSFDLGIVTKLAISSNMLNYLIEKKRFYEIGSLKGINQFNKFIKKKNEKNSIIFE
jgi:NDP-sugar pyrophosphorylase family protein